MLAGLVCGPCLDAGRHGQPFIPLTVRPVAPPRRPEDRLILAVSMSEERCTTEHGEVFDLPELVDRIRERSPGEIGGYRLRQLPDRLPPALIFTDGPMDLLTYLDQSECSVSPFWQWQVGIRSTAGAWRPEAKTTKQGRTYLIPRPARFGYPARASDGTRKKASVWWQVIDPAAFILEHPPTGIVDLLRFAIDLREWVNRHHLPLLPSVSAYGSRLLRDARFDPTWRRKVPASTNARLRPLLPGNHYQLTGVPGRSIGTAHKWDQAGAHHHAAFTNRFPHPDELDARGWYRRDPPPNGTKTAGHGAIRNATAAWGELTSHPGMFTIAIHTPKRTAADPLVLPALRQSGLAWQTITSGELAHIRAHHPEVTLGDIWCCWTSPTEDDRLREYALWAGGLAADTTPDTKRWVKPLLLAAYGMLAVRPGRFRNAWRWAHNPDGAVGWTTRHGTLIGLERSTKRDRESMVANVLWRAIIEASVRQESLSFARYLRGQGIRPLAIYADAVFAAAGLDDTRPLRQPWRYEGALHDLTFESPARYRSREEIRLPGTPHRGRDRQLANPIG